MIQSTLDDSKLGGIMKNYEFLRGLKYRKGKKKFELLRVMKNVNIQYICIYVLRMLLYLIIINNYNILYIQCIHSVLNL